MTLHQNFIPIRFTVKCQGKVRRAAFQKTRWSTVGRETHCVCWGHIFMQSCPFCTVVFCFIKRVRGYWEEEANGESQWQSGAVWWELLSFSYKSFRQLALWKMFSSSSVSLFFTEWELKRLHQGLNDKTSHFIVLANILHQPAVTLSLIHS